MKTATLRAAVAALCFLASPSVVFAVPEFPHDIQRKLKLSYEPECGLCHAKGNTGVGTVTTPFGLSMRAHGLSADDDASLGKALTALEDNMVDSDGDGVIDVDELSEHTSPNSPATTLAVGDPKWGCAVLGAQHASPAWPLGVPLALILVARARRRLRKPAR